MFAGLFYRNALWLLIIAVVAITRWSKYQDEQLKSRDRLRQREIEHRERIRELEVAIASAKSLRSRT